MTVSESKDVLNALWEFVRTAVSHAAAVIVFIAAAALCVI